MCNSSALIILFFKSVFKLLKTKLGIWNSRKNVSVDHKEVITGLKLTWIHNYALFLFYLRLPSYKLPISIVLFIDTYPLYKAESTIYASLHSGNSFTRTRYHGRKDVFWRNIIWQPRQGICNEQRNNTDSNLGADPFLYTWRPFSCICDNIAHAQTAHCGKKSNVKDRMNFRNGLFL